MESAYPASRLLMSGFRIAIFSYGLPCPGQKRGGIEQVAHDLSNALVDRGHAVTVFTYDPKPPTGRYATALLPAQSFVTSWLGRRMTMGYLGNVLALGAPYGDFDVIIALGDSLLLPLRRKPVIRIMCGSALEEARSATSFARAILQSGVYVQELLTALTQPGTVAISRNTCDFNPFIHRTIAIGVDSAVFRPNVLAKTTSPSILFVGALTGRKRGAWLLERFTQDIRPLVPDAQLHMVTAPGPTTPGVTYHSGVTSDVLRGLYQQAWVYASPSSYEGFGLPYVESLASGTPVVASPNPGSLEVLDAGRYGVIADDASFASSVLEFLQDADRRAEAIRLGLERAREYDIARTAEQYETLITEMVGARSAA